MGIEREGALKVVLRFFPAALTPFDGASHAIHLGIVRQRPPGQVHLGESARIVVQSQK